MVEQNYINRKLEGKIITHKEKNITMERQFFVLRKLKVNWTVLSFDKTKTLFFNNFSQIKIAGLDNFYTSLFESGPARTRS